MLDIKRAVRRLCGPLSMISACAFALSLANACGDERAPAATAPIAAGRMEIALTAVTPSNTVYRLRDATFAITGQTTGFAGEVSTEDDPDRSAILLELPSDTYEVLLQPGFVVERLAGAPAPNPSARRSEPESVIKAQPLRDRPGAAFDGGAEPAPSEGTPVEAQLISANPALVGVTSEVVSRVSFVFAVQGQVIETGSGVLALGIEVVEQAGLCSDDSFEPNDDSSQATPLTPGVTLEATSCPFDLDVYTFTPPVAEGEAFNVVVDFVHELGDIDAALLSLTSGEYVAIGAGIVDGERLFAFADGGAYQLEVYLFSGLDTGSTYSVDVGAPPPATNDCCSQSDQPGCSDPVINRCVCETDALCCSAAYDDVCVAQAIAECAAECAQPAPESDCCAASAVPGCTVPDVSACVCAVDPYCCAVGFDQNCANLAQSTCAASCE
jgi:hypothetical protein